MDKVAANLPEFLNGFSGNHALDTALGLVGIYLTCRLVSSWNRGSSLPLPPGPKPLPLLGNLLDFPSRGHHEARFFSKHKDLYGPISSIQAFGLTFILLNDKKYAVDLLEKRSATYSDRPRFVFGGEMIGVQRWLTTMMQYDTNLKLHRKLFHTFLGSRNALTKYEELQWMETRKLLYRLYIKPDNFLEHLQALPGAIILKMTYGYKTTDMGPDPLVELADEVMNKIVSQSCTMGTWLVDILPFLRNLPKWMPGADFRRLAIEWAKPVTAFYEWPFAFTRHQMATGKAEESFVYECFDKGVIDNVGQDIVKQVASTMYAGGADTTTSALKSFFLAMTLYPEVLKRAQEEIDRVIGPDRLPTFADRKDLPYIEAVLKETLRWENVLPLDVAHTATEEDTYMGYRIPKGAAVIANIWHMAHDSQDYPDPLEFKPERFIVSDGKQLPPDPRTVVFGFGRRICAGKDLADATLYIVIAMTAAVFNVSKAKDEHGNVIEPVVDYPGGVICHPKPYRSSITPRSEKAINLIRAIQDEHPLTKGDSETLLSLQTSN